jgi:hypothetical protein
MDTPWTITEFDLSAITFQQHSSFRENAIATAIAILLVIAALVIASHWNEIAPHWHEWLGRAAPWLTGVIALVAAVGAILTTVERTKQRTGMQAAADIADRSSLDDIPADQLDHIGPIAGASVRDVGFEDALAEIVFRVGPFIALGSSKTSSHGRVWSPRQWTSQQGPPRKRPSRKRLPRKRPPGRAWAVRAQG